MAFGRSTTVTRSLLAILSASILCSEVSGDSDTVIPDVYAKIYPNDVTNRISEDLFLCVGSTRDDCTKFRPVDDDNLVYNRGEYVDGIPHFKDGFWSWATMSCIIVFFLSIAWFGIFMLFERLQLLVVMGFIFYHGYFHDSRVLIAFLLAGVIHIDTKVRAHREAFDYRYNEPTLDHCFQWNVGSRTFVVESYKSES